MKKLFLLLVAVLTFALSASAQGRVVTGTVLEKATEEPVLGASVYAGQSNKGVETDLDGNFRISVPAGVQTLRVVYVGCKTATVNIPASNKVTVYLESDVDVLDEVMVVAYGQTKKSEYTGSAGVVNATQLEDALVSNVTNALSGKIAGVQTFSSNGQPGQSASVRIRGVGSINASTSPLYVVDGLPFDGDIATIAPSDIESMTVLKDAASAALYGARGANGVILITTKKGKSGNAKVTVDMRWGGNSRAIPNYDVVTDPRQYFEMVYGALKMTGIYVNKYDEAVAHAYANDKLWSSIGYQTWTIPTGQETIGMDGKFNPNATPGYTSGNFYFISDDWTKHTLINGLRQEYNMSITGGTDKINYYVSGSYLGDEGLIQGSHYNRFSTRATVDYQAFKWLKIGTNLTYTYANQGYPGDQDLDASSSVGNAFNLVNSLAPVYPLFIRGTDGKIAWNNIYNKPIYDYGTSSYYYEGFGRTPSRNTYSSANPAGDLQYNKEEYLSDVLDGKWYALITPITGLNITGTAGYHVDNTRTHYLRNGLYGSGQPYKGQAIQEAARLRTINLQALASYNKTFADVHNMDLMVGFENQAMNYETVSAVGSNLYQPLVWVVDNTIDNISGGGNVSQLVHRGFFGRAKYTYDGRYFFMGSIRRDGSSRFHPNHRWGTFWSLSGGWDIAKEKFMQDVTAIDLLKFKVSFGQNGNDGIGTRYLAYADQYQISGADGIWSDGVLNYKGNPDITWETSNNFNTGFDFSFLKGRIDGSIEYFQRQTSDMLFNIPTAPSLGYSSKPANVGSMRNNGIEIDLNFRPIQTKDITLDVFGNITFGWNKVLKLDKRLLNRNANWRMDSEKGWLSGSRIFFEGQSMYNLFYVDYAGVAQETVYERDDDGEIVVDSQGNPVYIMQPGNALYWAVRDAKDENGNKIPYITHEKRDENGNVVLDENGNPVIIVDQYLKEEYKTGNYTEAYNTNRKATGNIMPKAYGGFGATLQAYGIDLSLNFSYQFGGKIYDTSYAGFMTPGSKSYIGNNFHKDLLNSWTPTNTNTDIPRMETDPIFSAGNSTSTRFLVSSNFVSLNNVTLGYTLPQKWTRKAFLESVRLYCSAENVALWSKRKGLDPRQGFVSSENSTYSPIRCVSGGLKVVF
ncbi:MAG: TonB-dependent receptor [Bacteroidales bacterium]|nr:TonB-dependent receptor [Bacteroidales bacterium]